MCSHRRPPRKGDNKKRNKEQHTKEGNTSGPKTWECPDCKVQNYHKYCDGCGKRTKGSTSAGRRQIRRDAYQKLWEERATGNNAHHTLYQMLQEERATIWKLVNVVERMTDDNHKQVGRKSDVRELQNAREHV